MSIDDVWIEKFITAWNEDEKRASLACLGNVRFELSDDPKYHFVLGWDSEGTVAKKTDSEPCHLSFAATRVNWRKFLGGEVSASNAVMSGMLVFTGEFRSILPFTLRINHIATVASRIS